MKLRRKQQRRGGGTRQSKQDLPSQKAISYSYYRSQDKNDQKETGTNKKNGVALRMLAKRGAVLALFLVISMGSIYLSTLTNQAQVSISDSAGAIRDDSVYEQHVADHINKSVLNRSKLTFDTRGLIDSLRNDFPEVAEASISLPIFSRAAQVDIQVAEPRFLLVGGSSSALVGENGVTLAIVEDDQNMQNEGFTRIIDETSITPEPGKVALPSEQARFLNIIREQLAAKDVQIESLTINASPYDLRVRIKGAPYYVKFNVLEDPLEQVGTLLAFLGGEGEGRRSLPKEYVDVRVSERLFYR